MKDGRRERQRCVGETAGWKANGRATEILLRGATLASRSFTVFDCARDMESEWPPHSGPCHLANNRPGLRYGGFHSGASRHSRITFLELAFVVKRCPLQCKILFRR